MSAVALVPGSVAPATGAYLTDGKRLAQMAGVDAKGMFMLEDCGKPADEVHLIVVPAQEFLKGWLTVEAYARRKRARAKAAA